MRAHKATKTPRMELLTVPALLSTSPSETPEKKDTLSHAFKANDSPQDPCFLGQGERFPTADQAWMEPLKIVLTYRCTHDEVGGKIHLPRKNTQSHRLALHRGQVDQTFDVMGSLLECPGEPSHANAQRRSSAALLFFSPSMPTGLVS